MKVLHLLQSNQFSGAENVVCQIIKMFENDTEIEMVYCSRDGQIRDALSERGITFMPINELNIKEVKRVISQYQPDIIHAHDMRASFVAALCCGKIKLVSHIHNNAYDSRGLSVKSIAYLIAAQKAKHIFWVSQSSYEGYIFKKWFKRKSSVLRNIIDVDAVYEKMKLDTKEYDYDIVYVGRLSYPKNPQRMITVLDGVVKNIPSVKIAIVGTGEFENEVKKMCVDLNLSSNIDFLGFMSNPLKVMHDSKVMIMTSRWEGTPMCALEAMALGVPIVSTPTDGLCELIDHGVNGYLCDHDEDMINALTHLLKNEKIRLNFSEIIYEKSLSVNSILKYKKTIEELYRGCL